ncbi:MAG: PAS domain-containing protein [Kiloniellales bacterium]
MPDFRQSLSDAGLARFYDYWLSLCRGRPMPARKDIDPLQVPRGYLPNLMLIDVLRDPRRYRYRLVGANVVEATGANRTGQFFDQVAFFDRHPAVIPHYEGVIERRRPCHSLEPFGNLLTGSAYEVDRLLLPLSDDGQRVDTVLALFQFNSGPYASRLPAERAKAPSLPVR